MDEMIIIIAIMSAMAEVAAVISMAELANGSHAAYVNGGMSTYNPVENRFE